MTSQRRRSRDGRLVLLGAAWAAAFALIVALLLAFTAGVTESQGGRIAVPALRSGTAEDLRCSRNLLALGLNWRCRAEHISWQSEAAVPNGVRAQSSPYTILANTDLTGRDVTVSSHLPMNWRSGGRSGRRGEFIVAEGHPVGSQGWWAVQVWVPPVTIAILLALAVLTVKLRRLRRRRR